MLEQQAAQSALTAEHLQGFVFAVRVLAAYIVAAILFGVAKVIYDRSNSKPVDILAAAREFGLTEVMSEAEIIKAYDELCVNGQTWLRTGVQQRLFEDVVRKINPGLVY